MQESSSALGILGLNATQLASAGYTAFLNLSPGATKPQMMCHASLHAEIVAGAEHMGLQDFYSGTALFKSKTSRRKANVKSLQVCWVDLDCYTKGIVPTDSFVERLVDRAAFSGIPRPSHIVHSGRGLYLKWLLDSPVPDGHLELWNMVQLRLNQLFEDVGADLNAKDVSRVLRVVNTVNGKVRAQEGSDKTGLVRVTWDGGQRHSFKSLLQAVSLLDDRTAVDIKKAGAKVAHQVGSAGPLLDFSLPEWALGDIGVLGDYALLRQPRLDLEARSKAEGRGNGFSARTLAWCRWLDIRDVMQRRIEATGGRGIPEGSRDLTLMWMVNFLAQAGVVKSSNVHEEINWLLQAFDGVGHPGKRGFEHPLKSGCLNTLLRRIKASEAGHRCRFAGGLWDPKYTPSNDYLINLFRITSEEMQGMRTLIDEGEKKARADRKVEGRAERREARKSWNAEALRMRDEKASARQAGDKDAIPEEKVCATIAQALNLAPRTVREFFRRHDDAAALKEARKAGKAPPRTYRKAADLSPDELEERNRRNAKRKHARLVAGFRKNGYTGDGSPEDVQAWFDTKKAAYQAEMARNAAAAAEEARAKQEEGVRSMNAQLERLMRKVREGAGVPDVLDQIADGTVLIETATESAPYVATIKPTVDLPIGDPDGADLPVSTEAEAVSKTIFREISALRDNPRNKDSSSIMSTLPTLPSSPVEPNAVASATRKTSKRALLDKARKAQAKEALSVNANDPVIDSSISPPVEAGPAATGGIATSVIPPDLLESWCGSPADEPEEAGMPDLDDGYLDSFADGDAPTVGQPPMVASSGPLAGPAVTASRPPPVLAFARGTKPGSPAAAAGRGFGFNRPASAPAPGALAGRSALAPSGFSVRKPTVEPSKPLGFGAPARLSTDQARVNGQSQDFAKLFDEPQYDANGVPTTYPSASFWSHDDLPAGSRYTAEEWAHAREPDDELPSGHVVVELQVGNPISSALIKVPRRPAPEASAPPVARTAVINGKVVKQEPYRGIDDPMADAISDTIVVSRKSPIAAQVRGAVEGGIEISHGGVSSYFRIIRPRNHYSDPEKFIYINSKLRMGGSLSEAGARMAPKAPETLADEIVDQGENEQHEQHELEAAEAPRG